jgi:hypothetical protein
MQSVEQPWGWRGCGHRPSEVLHRLQASQNNAEAHGGGAEATEKARFWRFARGLIGLLRAAPKPDLSVAGALDSVRPSPEFRPRAYRARSRRGRQFPPTAHSVDCYLRASACIGVHLLVSALKPAFAGLPANDCQSVGAPPAERRDEC